MIFRCASDRRRQAVRDAPPLNGIDYLELAVGTGPDVRRTLLVHLVNALVGAPPGPAQWEVQGGQRYRGITVRAVEPTTDDHVLRLTTDRIGDLSWYTLRLVAEQGPPPRPPDGYDPALAQVSFSFRPGCGADLDCRPDGTPGVAPLGPPPLDYTAKDFQAFRRVLLDRMATLQPGWGRAEPADVRTVLVEALAHAADRLSYLQDVVATEAYLGTARERVSVRRLARLVDYAMHDGCAARAWVRLVVTADVPGPPAGTRLMTGPDPVTPTVVPASQEEHRLRAAGAAVFEVIDAPAVLYAAHEAVRFHTWDGSRCTLPSGATAATLQGGLTGLHPGDVLLLAPTAPGAPDPDPASDRRHPVRLDTVVVGTDPADGAPVTEVCWTTTDALPFDLPVTAPRVGALDPTDPAAQLDVAAAFGNLALVEHGETVRAPDGSPAVETLPSRPAGEVDRPGRVPAYRPRLAQGPVRQHAGYLAYDPSPDPATGAARPVTARTAAAAALAQDVAGALPDVALGSTDGPWTLHRDLLGLDAADRGAVLETDDEGVARLRFGDGANGRPPDPEEVLRATYAVGNGTAGNVGEGSLCRVLLDGPVAGLGPVLSRVTNPVAATGGVDPERTDVARLRAPYAHLTQLRCVTAQDYADRAAQFDGVERVAARLQWTGSWLTVYLYVDRTGGLPVDGGFAAELTAFLEPYRLMGHDLAVADPVFVPLDLELTVALRAGADWPTVRGRLGDLFSARVAPDGTPGLFHPDRLTFGAPVYTGPLLSTAQALAGVAWVDISALHTVGTGVPVGVRDGRLLLDPPQVPRLDNDPDLPDNGTFHPIQVSP